MTALRLLWHVLVNHCAPPALMSLQTMQPAVSADWVPARVFKGSAVLGLNVQSLS